MTIKTNQLYAKRKGPTMKGTLKDMSITFPSLSKFINFIENQLSH